MKSGFLNVNNVPRQSAACVLHAGFFESPICGHSCDTVPAITREIYQSPACIYEAETSNTYVLVWMPPAHGSVQTLHSPQLPAQSTAQGASSHGSDFDSPSAASQVPSAPPFAAATSTLKNWTRDPAPQRAEHSDHTDHTPVLNYKIKILQQEIRNIQ